MDAKNNLIKNVLIFSIGNLGSRFLVFFLVPLFSYYLSTSEMGYYDLVVVTIGLVVPLATIQLSDSIYRWLLDIKDKKFHEVISTSFILLGITIIIFLLLIYILTFFFEIKYKWLVAEYFLISCIYPFVLAIARGMRLNKLYALSGIINSLILVFLNWLLLTQYSLGIKALFIASIVANSFSVLMLFYQTKMYKYISFTYFSKTTVYSFVSYSLPLIPNAISWWFINSANRYLILYFLGEENNGIYAMSNRIAMALYAVNSIFNLAWQESAISEFDKENKDKFYSEIFNKYFILQISVIILMIPLSKLFVLFFVSEEFIDSCKYMPLLLIGVAFASFSAFFGTGYLSAKKTIGAFSTTIYGAIVNIVLSFLLIPLLGLHGATIGIVSGFIVTWFLRIYQTKKYFNIIFDKLRMGLILGILGIAVFLNFNINNPYGLCIFAFICLCVFIFFNKSMINQVFKKIIFKKVTQ